MNILWITNIMLPSLCKALSKPVTPTGGWMESSLSRIKEARSSNRYAVATIWSGNELKRVEVDGVVYYLLPLRSADKKKYQPSLESYWRHVKEEFAPDVVHIHGTEFPHGLAYVRECGSKGVVASIQGLVSVYDRYFTAGLSDRDVRRNRTFRTIIKHDNILQQQQEFARRGKLEKELIGRLYHIIGRTVWDKDHVISINPKVNYHFCGETLRKEFYAHKWSYEDCQKHSIFVSQAGYPLKGLHMLLKAVPIVLSRFADTEVYVAGADITRMSWYRMTDYGKYLKTLIKELGLTDKVKFTGMLNEQQMCQRYLQSNLFVCPSSIENSPNSLGEAQMLGMPYVASFVGGVPEIVNYNPEVIYRFEEYEMLAQRICEIFDKQGNFTDLSDLSRYDGERNCTRLLEIYDMLARS